MFVYEKSCNIPCASPTPTPSWRHLSSVSMEDRMAFGYINFCPHFVCKKRVPEKPDTLFYDDVQSMAGRSSPMKNTATVPGPLWDPMMVPMSHRRILPFSLGKRSSRASISIRASSGH